VTKVTRRCNQNDRQFICQVPARRNLLGNSRQRLDQRQSSARATNSARNASRSTVVGDLHSAVVHWKGDDDAPAGAAKARFLFRRAFLHGME
jgi:hypothetical protein